MLRHGHAVYALKRARAIAEFKAVSQNLMRSDLTITNGVHGVLGNDDMRPRPRALAAVSRTVSKNSLRCWRRH
jgi:hypothetical protein